MDEPVVSPLWRSVQAAKMVAMENVTRIGLAAILLLVPLACDGEEHVPDDALEHEDERLELAVVDSEQEPDLVIWLDPERDPTSLGQDEIDELYHQAAPQEIPVDPCVPWYVPHWNFSTPHQTSDCGACQWMGQEGAYATLSTWYCSNTCGCMKVYSGSYCMPEFCGGGPNY